MADGPNGLPLTRGGWGRVVPAHAEVVRGPRFLLRPLTFALSVAYPFGLPCLQKS